MATTIIQERVAEVEADRSSADIIAELRADQAIRPAAIAGCHAALTHTSDERDYVLAYRMIERSFGK